MNQIVLAFYNLDEFTQWGGNENTKVYWHITNKYKLILNFDYHECYREQWFSMFVTL